MTTATTEYTMRGAFVYGSGVIARGGADVIKDQLAKALREKTPCEVRENDRYLVAAVWQDSEGFVGKQNGWVWVAIPELSIEDSV